MISHLLISLDLNKIQPLVALRGKRVADLGSGLGIILNILHKLTKTKVYFIDIPENLILAAAISMYFSPTAKKYFYDPNKQINDNYDMYFIPHYAINKIPKNFISLFINIASLPEMRKVSSKYYMDQIYKSLEINGKFFSVNRTYTHQHKTFTDFNMTSIRDIVGEVSFEIEKSLPLQNSYSYVNENNNNTEITLYKKI
jgi:putative sugar O-methyltransferase